MSQAQLFLYSQNQYDNAGIFIVCSRGRGHALAGPWGKVQSTDNIDTISGRDHGGRNLKGDNLIGKAMRIQSGQQKGYLDCLIEFLRPFHCRQVFP